MFRQTRFMKCEPYYRSIILIAYSIMVTSVQYLKNNFAIFDCLHHSRFSRNLSDLRWSIFTESFIGREWQIARDCITSNQDITGWSVFSNLFHAFGAMMPIPNLIFIFFFVLFWNTSHVYPDGAINILFLFE